MADSRVGGMADEPKIYIELPGVEDLSYPVALIRATGAHGAGRRTFVIDGPTMTTSQVAALMELMRERIGTGEAAHVHVEPPYEVPSSFIDEADRWWRDQQPVRR